MTPDVWTVRRKFALDVRDAAGAALDKCLAAGLPTAALEYVRDAAQRAYDAWVTQPEQIPADERDAIVADLRDGLGLIARMRDEFQRLGV
jgi:hypothetical protein